MGSKPEEEWTEDDRKQVAEYENKVRELEEEREKYRKQLEAELKKIQAQIHEAAAGFDDLLHQLMHRKIKTEMVIYQVQTPTNPVFPSQEGKHSLFVVSYLSHRK